MSGNKKTATAIGILKLYFLSLLTIALVNGNLLRVLLEVKYQKEVPYQYREEVPFTPESFYLVFFDNIDIASFLIVIMIIVSLFFVFLGNISGFKKLPHFCFLAFLQLLIYVACYIFMKPQNQ